MLDTVLVVGDYADHTAADCQELRETVSPTYEAVTIDSWFGGNVSSVRSHRFYRGATSERIH